MYGVPRSTIYQFIKSSPVESSSNIYDLIKNNWDKKLSKDEKEWIRINTLPPKPPITVDKLNLRMNDIFCPKNRNRDIKNYLKNELNLSYKKGSSTTKSGASEHTKLLQSIFSANILDQIYDNKYLVSWWSLIQQRFKEKL